LPSAERAIEPQAQLPLAPFTTIGVGGPARWFAWAESNEDVVAAHRWAAERGIPLFLLGGGSNLIVADEGLDALVLHVSTRGIHAESADGETVFTVAAGEPWDAFVALTVSEGLAGLECLSGIPGSVGGTPIQNVGAYGQEVSGAIEFVTVFDRTADAMTTLSGLECEFDYRMSRFKREDRDRFIVCAVTFRLRAGAATLTYPDIIAELERQSVIEPTVADVREAVLNVRRGKGMVLDRADPDTRSVGSFFMNPVVPVHVHAHLAAAETVPVPGYVLPTGAVKIPAAWLIERAGFAKGYQEGAIGLSSKHPLALVNRGGATARDVIGLAVRIKRRVADRFGISLRPEPVFAGFHDDPDISYLQQTHA
jgi:UDP-N-acetylmuramate dehydrogenase